MAHEWPKDCPGRHRHPTRRQFVSGVLAGAAAGAAACAGSRMHAQDGATGSPDVPTTPIHKLATDQVTLGATGIKVSRLALGTGTNGVDGASDQTRLGIAGLAGLLGYGYSEGLNFFDSADQYGSHPHVAEALKQVGRQNAVVLTKTHAQTAAEMRADLDRFRRELGTELLDIVLLHNKQSGSWTTECAGAMEELARAKESGIIRAHGVSCHTLAALKLAARTPWVDVDLARVNPDGIQMDSDPATVIDVLKQMKAAGKSVIGMKILGAGELGNQLDRAVAHAVALDCIDGFTIGFTSRTQLDQVMQKIATV
jgi:aryl-alcohol dehydrogenase-like predicted oxidoreductase